MQSQGAWIKWEEVLPKMITWSELWKMEPLRIKFWIRSVYDVLPTPTNLVKWGIVNCVANLEHCNMFSSAAMSP